MLRTGRLRKAAADLGRSRPCKHITPRCDVATVRKTPQMAAGGGQDPQVPGPAEPRAATSAGSIRPHRARLIVLTYQRVGYVCPTRLEQGLNPPRARKFSEKSLVHQNDFRCDRNDFVAVEMNLSLMPFGRR